MKRVGLVLGLVLVLGLAFPPQSAWARQSVPPHIVVVTEGKVGGHTEDEHDVSMARGPLGATARATRKGEAPSMGRTPSVSGLGPTGGLLTRRPPSDSRVGAAPLWAAMVLG